MGSSPEVVVLEPSEVALELVRAERRDREVVGRLGHVEQRQYAQQLGDVIGLESGRVRLVGRVVISGQLSIEGGGRRGP
jgi:hypothetical protein